MKAKSLLLLSLLLIVSIFTSCNDDDDDGGTNPNPETDENVIANKWIYEEMSEKYLWNANLTSTPKYKQDSEKFFESILYKRGEKDGDLFSWIESNKSAKATGETDLGFEYMPVGLDATTLVGFMILYTKRNTDAEAKGLKRGHIIHSVNGTQITRTNYKTILAGKSTFQLSIYDLSSGTTVNTILPQISLTHNYEENPIYMSKVVYEGGGRKVGYIMYNQFDRGTNNKYDIQLAKSIDSLKTEGINELVLDLRYNPGGYVISAVQLASALVPSRSTSKVFAKNQYNPTYHAALVKEYGKNAVENDYFMDKVYGSAQSIPQLGINRIYILATDNTASASELMINGLKAYMPVKHIGVTTVGKDKGSITLTPSNSSIKWQLQPLVMRITDVNGKGNYINGLVPDIEIEEFDYAFAELGSTNDPLLGTAIMDIAGGGSRLAKKSAIPMTRIKDATISQKEENYQMFVDDKFLK